MGTTADKLQAVLNAKNAIKAKFNLSDNLPFSKYAENIKIEHRFHIVHVKEDQHDDVNDQKTDANADG